jgi:hypothetical protein
MLVIAITSAPVIKKILEHLDLPTAPPRVLPARRFWEEIPDDWGTGDPDQRQFGEPSDDDPSSPP